MTKIKNYHTIYQKKRNGNNNGKPTIRTDWWRLS